MGYPVAHRSSLAAVQYMEQIHDLPYKKYAIVL